MSAAVTPVVPPSVTDVVDEPVRQPVRWPVLTVRRAEPAAVGDEKERPAVGTGQQPELAAGMKPPVLGWGAFVQAVLDFLIVAFVIFLVVKGMNAMRRKEEATPAPPENIVLLREIRDALRKA